MVATSLGLNFDAGPSYAVGMSSVGEGQDDYPNLGLDTKMDVLS
jgi:hypothetical protein